MTDDRRNAPRASLSGIRATYEGAGGDPQDAVVLNVAIGGLFLRTETPLGVGKRVSLDLHVAGETAPWSALGRIIWTRPADEGPARPAGMGVKLIDVEDAVVDAIDRLVASREPTEPGVGERPAAAAAQPAVPVAPILQAPPRERTMLGVGLPIAGNPSALPPTPAIAFEPSELVRDDPFPDDEAATGQLPAAPPAQPAAPAPPAAPAHEPPAPLTPEPSLAINLVSKKRDSGGALDDEEPIRIPKRRGGRVVLVLFLLLAAVGGTAFAFRDHLPTLWHRARFAVNRALERLH